VNHPASTCHDKPRAFTLLEVMLAVTIIGLISLAVLAVFRTGLRTYEGANREVVLLQRGRYVFDFISNDVANVFYRDENTYNVTAREMIEQYQQALIDAELNNTWHDFERMYGPRDDDRAYDDPSYVGNPFEKYRLIDLQFEGVDGGMFDRLTLARRQNLTENERYLLYGLERVNYTVEAGLLIRSSESVDVAPRSWDGEILEKEIPPNHVIIAEGIKRFDLSYGFWWDYQWYEVENWNSSGRQIRNPAMLLGEYDYDEHADMSAPQPGSPGWNDYLNDLDEMPYDGLPTYIRVSVELEDPGNADRTMELTKVLWIGSAQETWVPNRDLEERDREMELEERDQRYTPVMPGALRKNARWRR
jgi:prepilin-type N-terminal cleavage/methylation domain-containing protein